MPVKLLISPFPPPIVLYLCALSVSSADGVVLVCAFGHVCLHIGEERVPCGVVRYELALDIQLPVLDVLCHLLDAVLEAGELDDDGLSALSDHVGLLQDDDLVIDGVLGVVDVDLQLSAVHDGHSPFFRVTLLLFISVVSSTLPVSGGSMWAEYLYQPETQ